MRTAASKAVALQGDTQIIHALNRLAFGPRAGDVERVRQMGLDRWIEAQLYPGTVDDTAVEAKVARLKSLQLSPDRLMLAYEADTSAAVKMFLQAQQRGEIGGKMAGEMAMDAPMARRNKRQVNEERVAKREAKLEKSQALAAKYNAANLKPQQIALLKRIDQHDVELGASVQAVGELVNDKVARAAESNRQLQEVLVDFWSNHFNLDVKKGLVRTMKIVDERDVIRPRVLGKFRDLLGASAKSPAMLFYLDNFRSTREYGVPAGAKPKNKAARKRGGVNENYARELMELHTLGVDGGYTQKDVQEVARCLTGWSIDRDSGAFMFRPFAHDDGEKIVLGRKIPAGGGQKDGEMVLDILASHPATAKHIAGKLCKRFIADEPPVAAVERAAQAFLKTGGDLREVVRTIVGGPEFFSSAFHRSKIKSPFEFAISAVRVLGGQLEVPDASQNFGRLRLIGDGSTSTAQGGGRYNRPNYKKSLAQQIALMGQPLYAYQAPTGWPEDSREWVSTGALIARLNYTLSLAGGEVAMITVSPTDLLQGVPAEDREAVLNRLFDRLLGNAASPGTRATLLKQMTPGTPADARKLTALTLGSPEFQRR